MGKKGEYTDREVTIFLLVALLISIVSTAIVLLSLKEATSVNELTPGQIVQQGQSTSNSAGVIGFTILENKQTRGQNLNATK